MLKNAQSTPFAKLKMILQNLDIFHKLFGHNTCGGLWVSMTVPYKHQEVKGVTIYCQVVLFILGHTILLQDFLTQKVMSGSMMAEKLEMFMGCVVDHSHLGKNTVCAIYARS